MGCMGTVCVLGRGFIVQQRYGFRLLADRKQLVQWYDRRLLADRKQLVKRYDRRLLADRKQLVKRYGFRLLLSCDGILEQQQRLHPHGSIFKRLVLSLESPGRRNNSFSVMEC